MTLLVAHATHPFFSDDADVRAIPAAVFNLENEKKQKQRQKTAWKSERQC